MSQTCFKNTLKSPSQNLKSQNVSGSQKETLDETESHLLAKFPIYHSPPLNDEHPYTLKLRQTLTIWYIIIIQIPCVHC